MNIRKAISVMAGVAGVMLVAGAASAAGPGVGTVSLPINTAITPIPGASVSAASQTLLASTSQSVNASTGLWTGELYSAVYQNTSTGFLTFVYQAYDGPTSPVLPTGDILRLSTINFNGYTTAIGQSSTNLLGAATPTIAATEADRDAGPTIGFNFLATPGTETDLLFITTNAKSYSTGQSFLQDGGQAQYATFEPTPEPSTIAAFAVMGLGVLGLIVRARRRTGFTGQMA
jgi:hypothetical protein